MTFVKTDAGAWINLEQVSKIYIGPGNHEAYDVNCMLPSGVEYFWASFEKFEEAEEFLHETMETLNGQANSQD